MLFEGEGSNRVDVVFDVYRDILVEREFRGENDVIIFKNFVVG